MPELQDCKIETDTTRYNVQTTPPLIVATDKATGQEDHITDPDQIIQIWRSLAEVQHSVKELVKEGESLVIKAGSVFDKMLGRNRTDNAEVLPEGQEPIAEEPSHSA